MTCWDAWSTLSPVSGIDCVLEWTDLYPSKSSGWGRRTAEICALGAGIDHSNSCLWHYNLSVFFQFRQISIAFHLHCSYTLLISNFSFILFTTYFPLFVYAARLFIIFIGIMVLYPSDSFILHLYTYIFCSRLSLVSSICGWGCATSVIFCIWWSHHSAGQQGFNFLVILCSQKSSLPLV